MLWTRAAARGRSHSGILPRHISYGKERNKIITRLVHDHYATATTSSPHPIDDGVKNGDKEMKREEVAETLKSLKEEHKGLEDSSAHAVQEIFNCYDTDESGTISRDEFSLAIEAVRVKTHTLGPLQCLTCDFHLHARRITTIVPLIYRIRPGAGERRKKRVDRCLHGKRVTLVCEANNAEKAHI